MNIELELFKKAIINIEKLKTYGFQKQNGEYVYETSFMNNSFKMVVTVTNNSKVSGKVIDSNVNEEYINFRIKNQTGEFANKVREEYTNILKDILDKCFDKQFFIYPQTNRITNLIKNKYKTEPEFLWKDSNHGVFRNKDTNKWFGIIMNIDKNKLSKTKSGDSEVLNIKLDGEVKDYLNEKGIYEAYHMNKKNWVSIILDDTLSDDKIMSLIEKSYIKVSKG